MKRARKPKPTKLPKPTIGNNSCGVTVDRNSDSGQIYIGMWLNKEVQTIGIDRRDALILARELLDMVIW